MTTVEAQPTTDVPTLTGGDRVRRIRERAFGLLVLACVVLSLAMLVTLLLQLVFKGWDHLDTRIITNFPSIDPELAGAQSALWGSIWVVGLAALIAVPIGVSAALYLEEFADGTRWWNRLIELNIQNLAGVPSIVYGILGLGFIARGPLDLGQIVLAASMTLALLILPTVVIASREAVRAVPSSIRTAALTLGASPWQAVWRQVVPASIPGIATGVILAVSRAMGEAAPVIMLGGLTFITFNPDGPGSQFTVLPIQIFNWVSRPQPGFARLAAATCVLLLVLLLVMNAFAIWLRGHYRSRNRW